ncbi:flagellar basal body P-ring formation chaperone FlgA [Sulfuriferula thiophila]|uniref:flagellar basal body P-ring formation chaperone FlgA n=1 Tax=Sulfuriferula thiophila TaxID=1781211 RepID=UPI000F608DAB|nr:flagellar basal body P-ring formation chaperone FlgA [Sulfuriferula thiophila]
MRSLLTLLCLLPALATAQVDAPRQDPARILHSVEQFLQTQTTGLPGQVKIKVGALDSRLNLSACNALEPFIPTGSRIWGKTTVGVRCSSPSNWTIYIQADISVIGNYLVSAAPLAQGQQISEKQLSIATGDLTKLPNGIITDSSQAIGKTVAMSIPAGTPLRMDALRVQAVIQQGQSVKLVSSGNGFEVSAEGRALTTANAGQSVQIRMGNGQVISGIARSDGIVEVGY